MTTARYSAYKPSGFEWLGDVPSHWRIDRLKSSITLCRNGIWGEEPQGDENDIPCVRVADFDRQRLRVELAEPTIRNVTDKERTGRLLSKGELLLEKSGGGENQPVGCVVLYDDARPAVCSNFVARVVPAPGQNSSYWRYVHAAAYAVRLTVGSINQTSGIQNLDQARYFNEYVAFPPPAEQSAIAAFLDSETAKIHALVEEQKRLIELLKEKRQAVISQAVTKGLDPNVPMKDSGVAWLGEVPAHWKVSSIKHIVATPVTDGPHETPNFPDEGIPFVSAEAVSSGELGFEKKRGYISVEDHQRYSLKYRPLRGDIFMIKSGATTGVTAIVETDDEFNIWSPLAVIRCDETCDPYFVLNFMRSRNFLEAVTLGWSFGTQQNIGMGVIENLSVTVPPLEEQREIAKALEVEMMNLDALAEEARLAISLLVERRSALISAAVTGKIDVRGLAPQPEGAAA